MQVTETKAEGLSREFHITVSAKDIEDKLRLRLEELGRTVRVPGFRPGKVPMDLLRKRYGDTVRGEILERAVTETSQQALAEQGVRPALRPKIEVTSAPEGGDLEFRMEVEALPEIRPPDFSKLQIERFKVDIDPAEVDRAVERLASRHRKYEPVKEPRGARKDDLLVIDFVGRVDGEEFEGGRAQDHELQLGSSRFVEGFEDQLIGAKPGDHVDVKVVFPEEYGNERLAGKEAIFAVEVKEIREPASQGIDDTLAKELGFETLDELRGLVRQQLEREYEAVARARTKRAVLDALAETHDFEVPQGMTELEFGAIWQQFQQQKQQNAVDPSDLQKSEEELKEEYRKIAERRVRLGLLLSEVGQANGIDVTQEELNRALIEEARRYPGQERRVIEFYQEHPEAVGELRAPIFEEKVIDFILDKSNVLEKTVKPEELFEQPQAGAAKSKKQAKARGQGKARTAKKGGRKTKDGDRKKGKAAGGTS